MRFRALSSLFVVSMLSVAAEAAPRVYCKVENKVGEVTTEAKPFDFDRQQTREVRGFLEESGVEYLVQIEGEKVAGVLSTSSASSISSDDLTREHGFGKMDVPLHLTNTLKVKIDADRPETRQIVLWCIEK
jgi:hypothetical protein